MYARPGHLLPLVIILITATLAGTTLATADGHGTVGSQPFSGVFQAYTGAGDAYGLYPGGLDAPEGALDVPLNADRVKIVVDWAGEPDHADRLGIRLCEGWCTEEGARVLTTRDAVPPIELVLDVPASGNVTWDAFVGQGIAVDAEIQGTAIYLDEDTVDPEHPQTSSTQAPTGSQQTQARLMAWVLAWTTVGGFAAAGLAWVGRRLGPLGLLGLYHRIDKDELLDNPTRAAIYELVDRRPGIHFSLLARELGLGRRRLSHHLSALLAADLLVEHEAHGYRCLFLPGQVPPEARQAAAVLKADGARAVLSALVRTGADDHGADVGTLQALAQAAGVSISTASHHLERLEAAGLVGSRRVGRARRLAATGLGREAMAEFCP